MLIVARERTGTLLGVRLSSQDHHDPERIPIGAGTWDGEGSSWVDVERVLRVHPEGMRREAASLDRERQRSARADAPTISTAARDTCPVTGG